MANWTDLSSAFAYGTKLTSAQMQQLRDNITALSEGASGAPSIVSAAIGNDEIDSQHYAADSIDAEHYASGSVDKTALGADCVGTSEIDEGTGSAVSTLAAGTTLAVSMQDYCFFPNIGTDNADDITLWAYTTIAASNYTGRFAIKNEDVTTRNYSIWWRYITATDEPFIYAIRDKTTGDIIGIWACTDPPSGYWGLDDKPSDFIPPLIYDPPLTNVDEITIFKYPMDGYKELIQESTTDKKMLNELLTEKYEYDAGSKLFKSKNLLHI